ncbi:DUF1427 family protein [Streptomyces sp. NPDC005551]|uniref:DUF1427 family protein n=1 Tax=unclassified Streptomyces TaxID=2593676 RepID=UPI00340B4B20
MSAPSESRAARAATFLRAAGLSFAAGLLMGAVYWALGVTSPAPPLLGLTGLAGIVAGERAASAVRSRRARRPAAPQTAPAAPSRPPSAPGEDTPS